MSEVKDIKEIRKEAIKQLREITDKLSEEVTFEVDADTEKIFEVLGIKKENNFGRMQYKVTTLLNLIVKQQEEIIVLENTKNTCPALNTSGVLCPLKTMITGEPIENALVMPTTGNVTKEIAKDIYRKLADANRFNPFNGKYER